MRELIGRLFDACISRSANLTMQVAICQRLIDSLCALFPNGKESLPTIHPQQQYRVRKPSFWDCFDERNTARDIEDLKQDRYECHYVDDDGHRECKVQSMEEILKNENEDNSSKCIPELIECKRFGAHVLIKGKEELIRVSHLAAYLIWNFIAKAKDDTLLYVRALSVLSSIPGHQRLFQDCQAIRIECDHDDDDCNLFVHLCEPLDFTAWPQLCAYERYGMGGLATIIARGTTFTDYRLRYIVTLRSHDSSDIWVRAIRHLYRRKMMGSVLTLTDLLATMDIKWVFKECGTHALMLARDLIKDGHFKSIADV